MSLRRPFGHLAWSTPFRSKAELVLSTSEAAPLSLVELAEVAGCETGELLPADTLLGYSGRGGSLSLRNAIAQEYPGIDADAIAITTGAGEAIAALAWGSTIEGGHVVVQVPTHESLYSSLERSGCELTALQAPVSVDQIESAVRSDTRAVFLTSPHNPTGQVFDEDDLGHLAEALQAPGALLVVDEVYRGVPIGKPVQTPAASLAPNAVSVSSLSKIYGLPGLRIGWVVGPPLVVDDVRTFCTYTSRCASVTGEALALVALEHREALLQRTSGLVYDALASLGALCDRHTGVRFSLPDGATVGFPEIEGVDVDAWCEQLVAQTGLLLAPGNACFGIERHVRLNLAVQRDVWAEAIPVLDGAFSSLPEAQSALGESAH